jgi:hypothetical protein
MAKNLQKRNKNKWDQEIPYLIKELLIKNH